jgi:hypothetical protein
MRFRHLYEGVRFTSYSWDYAVEDCYFGDIENYGINVLAYGNNARYIGNIFVRNWNGALLARGFSNTIQNNDFEQIGYNGTARVAGSQLVLQLTTTGGGFNISGNYFEENGDGATAGRSNIFVTGGGGGGIIAGNYMDGTCSVGACAANIDRNIRLNNTSAARIGPNTILNSVSYGIYAGGTCSGIDAAGNNTTDTISVSSCTDAFRGKLARTFSVGAGVFGAPGAVPGSVSVTETITGLNFGDEIAVAAPIAVGTNYILTAFVDSANTVRIKWTQVAGVAADPNPGGGTYTIGVTQH